ncbi:MAG: sigma-54 dependent transcriptional regulator [Desulfosarcinaceae bacterium]|nr:sigma-54 dependent transcriptional regulator [Desulfosarcinaceae bacterium]
MRRNLNLYVIIPIIFAGMSFLSMLITYRITIYYPSRGLTPHWPLAIWGAVLVLFTYVSGLLVVKFLIDPVKRFLSQTRRLGVVHQIDVTGEGGAGDDIPGFTSLFEQVSELLSKVEARQMFPEIIGQSNSMLVVLNRILKVAPTDATVLVTGETGTGKELVARSIHRHSHRSSKPFVALNCAAIPAGLIESELFGHEKGAFTGAHTRKMGKFETASGGTLFMDEIGDMPMETQAKLLRALEEQQIERLGSEKPVTVDVRIIAATNRDLDERVKDGRFRQDLFFRLNVFSIQLPPLRARLEDIPLLANHFLTTMPDSSDKRILPSSHRLLMAHDWPGNVRELKNAIESAAVLTADEIAPGHLPGFLISGVGEKLEGGAQNAQGRELRDDDADELSLDDQVRAFEKGLIVEALTESRGVQVKAAARLGIKERSLWHRIKKHQIDAAEFKRSG